MNEDHWFSGLLEGDKIVLRAGITINRRGGTKTLIYAFCGWSDDMAYNGAVFTYEHVANDNRGLEPLDFDPLDSNPNKWTEEFYKTIGDAPAMWLDPVPQVCTIVSASGGYLNMVPASNPRFMAHWPAMWAMTMSVPPDVGPYWAQSFQIVHRRLGGLIKEAVDKQLAAYEVI